MSQVTAQSTDELRTSKVEIVLQQLDSLPTLPGIVVRLDSNVTGFVACSDSGTKLV